MENNTHIPQPPNPTLFIHSVMIAIVLISFFLLEIIELPFRFQLFFTLILICILLYSLHSSLKRGYLDEKNILFFSSLIFIINKLYIPEVFESYFHIPFTPSICFLFALMFLRALAPVLKKIIKKFYNCLKIDENIRLEKIKRKNVSSKKTLSVETLHNPSTSSSTFSTNKEKHTAGRIRKSKPEDTEEKKAKSIQYPKTIILSTVSSLTISFFITFQLHTDNTYQFDNLEGNLSYWVTLLLLTALFFTLMFMVICMYCKLVKIMIDIFKNEESPFIYILGFFLISWLFTENGLFNQNIMLNILSEGDILSLPIISLILYPVFVFVVHTLKQMTKNQSTNSKIKNKAIVLAERLLKIGYDSLNSAIDFVEFVTSSLFDKMISLIKDDEEGDNHEE